MLNNPIWLKDLITLEQLPLQWVPRELDFDDKSTWAIISSPGRNHPFYHFSGGEDTLKFQIDWVSILSDRTDVLKNCKWVKSLSRNDSYNAEPHPIMLIWGNTMFSEAVWIVEEAPYRFTQFNREKDMMPIQAYQDVTLKRVVPENVSFEYIQRITT